MAMVLYGYDASVFNSVQASDNWLNWFGLNTVRLLICRAMTTANRTVQKTDAYLIGLINTAYTIGAIVAGFFIGGPTVSSDEPREYMEATNMFLLGGLSRPTMGYCDWLFRHNHCHFYADIRTVPRHWMLYCRSCSCWYWTRHGIE